MPRAELLQALDALWAALASLAVLVVMFVPLERVFPARHQRIFRPAVGLDLCFFFGQYLVWNALAIFIARTASTWIGGYLPEGLRGFFVAQPFWLQAVLVVLLGDVCVYWYHRACHGFDFLWRFHAVHHTSEHLDWVAAHREHPVDGVLTQLATNLPALLLGFSPRALAGFIVFRGAWAIFIHSNVRLPLGPLKWLLGAPELHHWHHARLERTSHNFANVAPLLDVIFGTHHCPKDEETYDLGVLFAAPKSYLGLLLAPFLPATASVSAETSSASRTP
ncbi:sterol desaturase family protein [Polyangium jinanense]|uniref:Sterol desaturase family protein n=1 Tax=Polyangium jinanense TaxID=2829994 RepID=A0A9X3WZG6_9BACT|nr:sterol desaturase family protein [Polyangium jinanense]MDC3954993.1 sterol desaturase family protein [Polyangium jinanense]MDC3981237.1 sterol desaturase family protein [Polyangium jinanense]